MEEVMLVLSRKTDQEVVIGGDIRVRVLEVRGNRVRLGFTAPDHIEIQRAEIVATGFPALCAEGLRPTVGTAAGRSPMLPSA
jgi:carbon storage regulator